MRQIHWGILAGDVPHRADAFVLSADKHPRSLVRALTGERNWARAAQHKWEIPKYHTDYESLIIDPDIHAVFIDTELPTRASLIKACLGYNKHVLCTAPMCRNPQELALVLQTAKQSACSLHEGMLACFMPVFQQIVDIIDGGSIGELIHLQASASRAISFDPAHSFFDPRNGGICYDIGKHPLALVGMLLGNPNTLSGYIRQGATDIEEEYALLFNYKQGQSAMLFASSAVNDAQHAHIYGTQARIHIHTPFYGQTRVSMYNKQRQSGLMKFNYEHNPYYYAIEDLCRSIENNNKESIHWSWAHSQLLMELIARIQKEVPIQKAN